MNVVTQGLFSAAAAADPEQVKKLNSKLLTAMQYMQMFETVKGVDYQLTVCSYHNRMDTISQITWAKGTVQSDKKAFEKAKTVAQLGPVLNLFNLYYVSAVTEEGVTGQVHQFTIYPSFQCDDKERALLSTQECIDNFNANFGVDGVFEDALKDSALDLPLTLKTRRILR